MHEQDKAILQTLVSVAWADGDFADREKQMLDGLLESYGASAEEAAELRAYAAEAKTLEDIPLTELSFADRRAALRQAVILTWVDGTQHAKEVALLGQLRDRLRIPEEEGNAILAAANEHAKQMLTLLKVPD